MVEASSSQTVLSGDAVALSMDKLHSAADIFLWTGYFFDQAAIGRGNQCQQATIRSLQVHLRVPTTNAFALEILRLLLLKVWQHRPGTAKTFPYY